MNKLKYDTKGLEGWLSGQEHLLLSRRTQVRIPAPTMEHYGAPPAPGNLKPSSGFCSHLRTCAHTQMHKHTHTQINL